MISTQQRFEKYFLNVGEHWEWIGGQIDDYGGFWHNGKCELAHRVSYELYKGPVPEGLCVLHTCDRPLCVNPEHLYAGTKLDNSKDMIDRNRNKNAAKTHCKNGHPLSGDNLYVAPSGKYRMCRIYQKERLRLNYQGISLRSSHGL
jgi:hypothetical protein